MLSEADFLKEIEQHKRIIYKVCHTYMDTNADREDLFQEILLNAWKGQAKFRGEAKFSTWLYRVALNTAISFLKTAKKRESVEAGGFADVTEATEEHANVRAMNRAISTLSNVDKALVMLYLENCSYREISGVLGISENNVAVKMTRIKKYLQDTSRKFLD